MQTIIAFFAIVFSMFQAASIRRSLAIQPDPHIAQMSEPVPSRAEIAQIRAGSIYAEIRCSDCQKTNVTYHAR
jgi:hypothetical protein